MYSLLLFGLIALLSLWFSAHVIFFFGFGDGSFMGIPVLSATRHTGDLVQRSLTPLHSSVGRFGLSLTVSLVAAGRRIW